MIFRRSGIADAEQRSQGGAWRWMSCLGRKATSDAFIHFYAEIQRVSLLIEIDGDNGNEQEADTSEDNLHASPEAYNSRYRSNVIGMYSRYRNATHQPREVSRQRP